MEHYGLPEPQALARSQAGLAAATIAGAFDPERQFIPAVLDGSSQAHILPAIEGLMFPYLLGDLDAVSPTGRFGDYVQKLTTHIRTAMQPGVCLAADTGGWRLSSTGWLTWPSKIHICEFIMEQILGLDFGGRYTEWDEIHASWERVGCADDAMVDQIRPETGVAVGSKFYPRGITSILFLFEKES